MKAIAFSMLALAALVAVLAVADDAQATGNCQPGSPTANTCKGFSMVGTNTGGVAGGRCFGLRTSNTAISCSTGGVGTTANEATWEMVAGACTTAYYRDDVSATGVAPLTPNKVTIQLYFDTAAAPIRTYLNAGAEPANGATFSFCATSDGTSGGSPRAGPYYIHAKLVKDNAVPSSANYNIATTGAATVGAVTSFDSGFLRGQLIVASITASAPAAGSVHAYGTGGDENIAVTSTITTPGGDVNTETVYNTVLDSATLAIGQAGATVDLDSGSLAQNFAVDQTFPTASGPYIAGFRIVGTGFNGLAWTTLAATGHGAGIVRDSDLLAHSSTTFTINPDVSFDKDGTGTPDNLATVKLTNCSGAVITLENRGETGCAAWYVLNARGEKLTRAMTFTTEDASANACTSHGSLTPTASLYSVTWAIPTAGSCTVANDLTGSARYMRATNTDQAEVSNDFLHVSSLYLVDPWTDLDGTRGLAPDVLFNVRTDGAGGDASDTIHHACQVRGVRDDVAIDTSGSAVSQQLKDPAGTTRATRTTDTDSSGWTPTDQTLLATTPLGDDWTAPCSVAFNGNTGSDTLTFEVGVEDGGGGETVYTGADPLTIFCGDEALVGEVVPCAVHSRLLDGEARLDAEDEIFVSVLEYPSMTPVVSLGSVIEADAALGPGGYVTTWEPTAAGAYMVVANTTDGATPIGAANIVVVREPWTAVNYTGNFSAIAAALAAHDEEFDSHTEGDWWNMDFDGIPATDFVALGLWILATIWCMRRAKLFAALAATVGIACVLIPGTEWIGWVGVLFFVLALWLEAVARERLPYHWFKGSRSVE